MLRVASILDSLFRWAPASLAWEKDNIGLLVGSPVAGVERVLVCLDVTEAVVDEAIERRAELIVAHHPVIFHPLSSLRTDSTQGRILAKLLRHDIAVIAMHTNADAAETGLNHALAELLGLVAAVPLDPAREQLLRLELRLSGADDLPARIAAFVKDAELAAWHAQTLGDGGYLLGVDVTTDKATALRTALRVAFASMGTEMRTFSLEDPLENSGIGVVGDLPKAMDAPGFLAILKEKLGCAMMRVTPFDEETRIKRVAVCSGAGTSYIQAAIASGAQCLVTGDLTHHTFLDYGRDILLVDAGHFETENIFVRICCEVLEKSVFQDNQKIDIFPVRINTNPVRFV